MNDQQLLFDLGDDPTRRLSRRGGPATSAEAAAQIAGRLPDVQAWVLGLVRRTPGRTAQELGREHRVGDIRQINRRLPELEEMGLVLRGPARRCAVTGRQAHAWDVAPAGDDVD